MARLEDVAKVAGDSRGTVSNVFDEPRRFATEVRERVAAAARQLGYAGPDPKGRLLMGSKVHAIGVMTLGARLTHPLTACMATNS